jgi:Holliday junction resolvase
MSRERGFQFEREFVAMAQGRGYKARRIPGHKQHDAVVGAKTVQCKDKEFDEQGRVRIARGQKKYKRGAWDVLALRWKGDLYLIPEQLLRTAGGTLLTVIRPRFFKRWINAWHVFDGQAITAKEPLLFSLDEADDGTHS